MKSRRERFLKKRRVNQSHDPADKFLVEQLTVQRMLA